MLGKKPSKKRKAPETPEPCGPIFSEDSLVDAAKDLSVEQMHTLHLVQSGAHVFLTGKAGCGKSHVVRVMVRALQACGTPYAVTASTGVAAEALGGCTLHKYVGMLIPHDLSKSKSLAMRFKYKVLRDLRVLIIDEVSMLDQSSLGYALDILRHVRSGLVALLPVMVFVGDFLQLPPVSTPGTTEPPLCLTDTWRRLTPHVVHLTHGWRQDGDVAFLSALDELRTGKLSEASLALFQSRVGVKVGSSEILPTEIHPLRRTVDGLNIRSLGALPHHVHYASRVSWAHQCETKIFTRDIEPCDPCIRLSLPGHDRLLVDAPGGPWTPTWSRVDLQRDVDAVLRAYQTSLSSYVTLAVGAQVMFTVNGEGYANGTRGVVVDTSNHWPIIQLLSGDRIEVTPVTRSCPSTITALSAMARTMGIFGDGVPSTCVLLQALPITMAAAMTVHKAQGATLDCMRVSTRNMFESGQLYVALSRVRKLADLTLVDFDPSVLRVDSSIVEYYAAMRGERGE